MKKLILCLPLAVGLSGCVIVPSHHPRPVVVRHRTPAPPPVVVVPQPRPAPPPVVVVPQPRPIPPPVVVVDVPRPTPPVVVVDARTPRHTPAPVVVVINPREREIIREYVAYKKARPHDDADQGRHNKHGKHKGLPRGLAKKVERGDDLPPGWQNKCVRGQIMPVEVYQRCEPLPPEVIVKLPAPPPGTIIVTLEGKAIRLLQATLEILDVFDVI